MCDFMCNDSLDKWIYRNSNPELEGSLTWDFRQSILAGVAAGVECLHEGWTKCVLHRGIKSANVMLDAEFSGILGDFGLARVTDHDELPRTTDLAGTFGYIEMMQSGRATKEMDVYAFGIMVFEVVCGRKALDTHAPNAADYVLLNCVNDLDMHVHSCGDGLNPRCGCAEYNWRVDVFRIAG